MSKIKNLIIHCTATPDGRIVTKEDIIEMHTAPKPRGRGWSRVGYSDMITQDGELINLQNWDQDDMIDGYELTNGARGFNSFSRHIVYVGGMDKQYRHPKDTRTFEQKDTLLSYVKFHIIRYPWIQILGHNQIANKACPSFNVAEWLIDQCISTDNIYGQLA